MDSDIQPAGATAAPFDEISCPSLLFVRDILSGQDFLVDSGASVSVFPGSSSSSSDGFRLLNADGSPIFCSGSRLIPLRFSCGSRAKVYTWKFQLAPVSVPLLGADFLKQFNFMVDIKGRKLVHADCPEDVVIRASPGPHPALGAVSNLYALRAVQDLFQDLKTISLPVSVPAPPEVHPQVTKGSSTP